MAKKKYTNKSGDTFEWEETEEMRKAIEKLHQDILLRKIKGQYTLYNW